MSKVNPTSHYSFFYAIAILELDKILSETEGFNDTDSIVKELHLKKKLFVEKFIKEKTSLSPSDNDYSKVKDEVSTYLRKVYRLMVKSYIRDYKPRKSAIINNIVLENNNGLPTI